MAGALAGFDAAAFRTAITNTMIMGLPGSGELQPTFYFRETLVYPAGTILDSEGKAIDPRIKPTATPVHAPVQVPCAVEMQTDNTNDSGQAGTFWTNRAMLTLLDVHYEQVKDAIEVDLSGRRYLIQQMTAVGLSTVTVFQLQCFRKGTGE